jgi:hypothetical protein
MAALGSPDWSKAEQRDLSPFYVVMVFLWSGWWPRRVSFSGKYLKHKSVQNQIFILEEIREKSRRITDNR